MEHHMVWASCYLTGQYITRKETDVTSLLFFIITKPSSDTEET